MDQIATVMNNTLGFLQDNTYAGIITIGILLYTALIAPQIPGHLFDHFLVRAVCLALVLMIMRYNLIVSLAVGLAFMVTFRWFRQSQVYDDLAHQLLAQHDDRHMRDVVDHTDPVGPQPQGVDSHHPDDYHGSTEVAAVLNANGLYQGPQGMQSPPGFAGLRVGAGFDTPD